jgi:hypothetical protein
MSDDFDSLDAIEKAGISWHEAADLGCLLKGEYLGSVEAPDRERAEAVAIKRFELDDDSAQPPPDPRAALAPFLQAAYRLGPPSQAFSPRIAPMGPCSGKRDRLLCC